MPKVSVIVPVYNVEKYIEKCLKSLVNQTLKDIEIIVVNDGTKDNSQKIIDRFVKKYSNVKSYIKENGGLSSARNYGLKKCKGEYIAFLDSDDYVELNMYEVLYNKAKENNFDVVACDINYVYDDCIKKVSSNLFFDMTTKEKIKKSMLDIYPAVWNKIYKRDLFKHNVKFTKGVWYEDVDFIYKLYPYINSIGVVEDYLINYVQREGAITKTFDKRVFNYIDNWNSIINYYKTNELYEEYKKELEYGYVRYVYATFIKAASNFNDRNMYKEAVNEAKRNVLEKFPKYRKNKYFYRSLKSIYLVIFNKKIASLIYFLKHRKR